MSEPAPSPRPRHARRRGLFRAFAVLGAFSVVFLSGEVFVRLRYDIVDARPYFWPGIYRSVDPPLRWDLRPDYQGVYHQQFSAIETHINALGMRDPELDEARRTAPRRVLFLGDSITFGRGVGDAECFARQLETAWGPGLAAFNAGVPGYDTVQELGALERFGPQLDPQLVVLEWYRNDAIVPSDQVPATVIEGHLADDRESYLRWKARYIDHTASPIDWSALIRFLRIHWKNFKLTAWKLRERAKDPAQLGADDRGIVRSFAAIRAMKAWCEARGARFALVLFPAREEVEVEGDLPPYHSFVAELCAAEGIPFLSLYELWCQDWKERGESLYLPRDRCHPNALGHAQVARWIDEAFRELVPPAPAPQ